MKVYTLTDADVQSGYNHSKTLVLSYLERNGLLKEGLKAEDLDKEIIVVMAQKGWFGRFFDTFWKTSDERSSVFVCKVG